MSIWTAFNTGASGIDAYGNAAGITGDNLANVSTVGFQGSRPNLSDLVNGNGVGAGVQSGGASTIFGQGGLSNSGRSLDAAIQGNGYFVVSGSHDGIAGSYYTRDGQFSLDNQGLLVDSHGMHVQGYMINAAGVQSPLPSDLHLGGQSAPGATGTLNVSANLDARAVPPPPFNAANPTATSNFATSTTVYDSLGGAHRVDVFYRANGGGNWEWHAMVDGGELTGGAQGTPTQIAGGTLSFNGAGALTMQTTTASNANFVGAKPNQQIQFNFGDPTAAGGTGLAGTTQFAGSSTVKAVSQDGFAAGFLSELGIGGDGTITATFSNGTRRPVARLALANFAGEQGLSRVGDQLYSDTSASGNALVGAAGTGGRGGILSGVSEGSNVDIGSQLVDLIAYQRAFSANLKTVSTADQMLQEVVGIKR